MCDILNKINIEENNSKFALDKIVYIKNFIKDDVRLKLLKKINETEDNYKQENTNSLLSTFGQLNAKNNTKDDTIFKKHSVITGSDIQKYYPDLHYYYHNCFADTVSKIVGKKVYPVNERNSTNNSLFIYEKKGDSLRWHTDGSLFNGKKVYTLLIYLYNSSTQNLCYIDHDNQKKCLFTDENSSVILEHFTLEHAVTPLQDNEKKILWTMTYAEDMNIDNPISYMIDKVKNYSYLGFGAFNSMDITYLTILFIIIIYILYIYRKIFDFKYIKKMLKMLKIKV